MSEIEFELDKEKNGHAIGWPDILINGLTRSLVALGPEDAAIARIAAAATVMGTPTFADEVKRGLDVGLAANVLAELCLQTTLYSGPNRIEALSAQVQHLIDVPDRISSDYFALGAAVRADLHAERDGQGYSDHKDQIIAPLYGVFSQIGYGAIWSRPGPTRRQRLICAVAALAVTGSRATFCKFCKTSLEAGLTVDELRDTVSWTVLVQGGPRTFDMLTILRDLQDAP